VLRRLLYIGCGLVLMIVIASAISNRISEGDRAVAPAASAAPPAGTVRGTLPDDGTVRARTGDAVSVTVRTSVPDEASVNDLGLQIETGPGVPGTIEFVAQAPGVYPVQLLGSGQTAGTIVVTRR
jgi:hypothetical protein